MPMSTMMNRRFRMAFISGAPEATVERFWALFSSVGVKTLMSKESPVFGSVVLLIWPTGDSGVFFPTSFPSISRIMPEDLLGTFSALQLQPLSGHRSESFFSLQKGGL